MRVTPKEAICRLYLLYYVQCLASLYDKDLSKIHISPKYMPAHVTNVGDVLTSGTRQQVTNVLSPIAFAVDTSVNDLEKILKGSKWPQHRLLYVLNSVISDRESLKQYLRIIIHLYHLDKSKIFKDKNQEHEFKISLDKGTEAQELNLSRYSVKFNTVQPWFVHAFKRAGFKINFRISLMDYIRAILYIKNKSMYWLAKRLGLSYGTLFSRLTHSSKSMMWQVLNQLPIALSIPKDDIEDILKGSRQPQLDLLKRINPRVKNRRGLRKYLVVFANLNDETLNSLSRRIGEKSSYFNSTLSNDSGEYIAKALCRVASLYHIPSALLLSALSRANVRSSRHSYTPHMLFTIDYNHVPLKYSQGPDKQKQDTLRVNRKIKQAKMTIASQAIGSQSKKLAKILKKVILDWGLLFGFDGPAFIRNNFRHFGNPNQVSAVVQDGKENPVRDKKDWVNIFRKIHYQLSYTRNAFSLPGLQKTPLAPYVYVKGVNLAHPYASDANIGLAPLVSDKTRYTFRGIFSETGIKVVNHTEPSKKNHEFYKPLIVISHVRCSRKPVAKSVELNYVTGFTNLGKLMEGDSIQFDARVQKVKVGEASKTSVQRITYRLIYPNNIKIVRRHNARQMTQVPTDPVALTGFAIENNKSQAYDFTRGGNYGYARYCIQQYNNWKKSQHINN